MNYYVFSVQNDFPNNKVDIDRLIIDISSADNLTTALDYIDVNSDSCEIYFKADLDQTEATTLSGVVNTHSGIPVLEPKPIQIEQEWRDRSGKLRVHQTSRKMGLITCWFGCGDDISDPYYIGNGQKMSFTHLVGDGEPAPTYIDFNVIDNETWLHEGYVTWNNAQLDTISLDILPTVTSIATASGTNYTLYNGHLIIPTTSGTGDIAITSDITTHSGGLVEMPPDDLGNPEAAYWDAEWDYNTNRYINITPNIDGTGKYNMFSKEIVFHRIVHEMPLLSNGFLPLNCSDTEQLGQGMRIRFLADTNNDVEDHDWSIAIMLCMHRDKTFNNTQYI